MKLKEGCATLRPATPVVLLSHPAGRAEAETAGVTVVPTSELDGWAAWQMIRKGKTRRHEAKVSLKLLGALQCLKDACLLVTNDSAHLKLKPCVMTSPVIATGGN